MKRLLLFLVVAGGAFFVYSHPDEVRRALPFLPAFGDSSSGSVVDAGACLAVTQDANSVYRDGARFFAGGRVHPDDFGTYESRLRTVVDQARAACTGSGSTKEQDAALKEARRSLSIMRVNLDELRRAVRERRPLSDLSSSQAVIDASLETARQKIGIR